MNREPIGFYIFRLITGLCFLFFMVMLYWSSVVVENRLEGVNSQINELANDVQMLRHQLQSLSTNPQVAQETEKKQDQGDSHNNILIADPFYPTTIQKLLEKDFTPSGVLKEATVVKPDNLHPFSQWHDVSSWVDQCTGGVSKLQTGKYETYAPDLGVRMEERQNAETGEPEFWIFLRDNVFWEPLKNSWFPSGTSLAPSFLKRHQVTSEDFKLWYDTIKNPFVQLPGVVSLRTYYGDIEEVRIIDKLTFVVRWKTAEVKSADGTPIKKAKYTSKQLTGGMRPLASFVYKYFADGKKVVEDDSDPETYAKNSVWAQNFSEHWSKNVIVSCGPWVFDGMTERHIRFVRNPNYYNPLEALTARREVEFQAIQDNVWQAFKANELTAYSMQPDQQMEYKDFIASDAYRRQASKGAAVKRLDFVSRIYGYVGWNMAKPLFSSKKVRQALTMAIDRKRIIDKNLDGMGIETNGTFYRYSINYNSAIQPWPFNPTEAIRILEEEGWRDTDGDGIRDKVIDGVKTPFKFTITYLVKNQTMKSICEYIATALKEIGIDCEPNGLDIADISSAFDDKSFDALAMYWSLGTPPEDVRQLWSSAGAKEKGSSNMVGFSNAEADDIIEKLEYEYNPKKRIELYHRFSAVLHDEQPYTFLYVPKTAFLYRETLQNVFLPVDRQDLIPGADVAEPMSNLFWLKKS